MVWSGLERFGGEFGWFEVVWSGLEVVWGGLGSGLEWFGEVWR